MNKLMAKIGSILVITALVFTLTVTLAGCKEKSPQPAPTPIEQTVEDANKIIEKAGTEAEKTIEDVNKTASETVKDANAAVAAIEQTNCPVMGGKINKDIFVEYKGKKVYFCCKGCVDAFNKEPEKYLSKLPQFNN